MLWLALQSKCKQTILFEVEADTVFQYLYYLVFQSEIQYYVPVHSMANAVCQKYQDVQLHLVTFCTMQASMLLLII